jgi:ATPase subunit of ABC transporter with duplicated ATPase domains
MGKDALLKQEVDTPTIIGVVGNTGAGKSSVINAMLEEERLVPTNCMRACTAVVTEMSWNSSKLPGEKYRADIEFISAAEWQKDLELSLSELIDANGQVSRDCTNPDSEAGIAYAKVKSGM